MAMHHGGMNVLIMLAHKGHTAGCIHELPGKFTCAHCLLLCCGPVVCDPACVAAGTASLSTDLSAAYHLLATRICPDASSSSSVRGVSGRDRSAAETPLAKSLLAVRDPQELTSK
jgi:hypothetical protein